MSLSTAVHLLGHNRVAVQARDRWALQRTGLTRAIARLRGLAVRFRAESGHDLLVGPRFRLHLSPRSRLQLGQSVRIMDGVKFSLDAEHAQIRIGDRTFLNTGVTLHSRVGITIGSDCMLAWDVLIADSDFHSLDGAAIDAPVAIRDHVWIGTGARILKGVTIGRGAVVAAGSLVRVDVEEQTLVGGNPARVIKRDVTWQP